MTTCGIDAAGAEVCSLHSYVAIREPGNGKNKFDDVTQELTTVTYCTEVDPGTGECIGKWVTADIFDNDFVNYLWSYENDGVKLLQLRFYLVETINKEF